jgi:hypothetical protein
MSTMERERERDNNDNNNTHNSKNNQAHMAMAPRLVGSAVVLGTKHKHQGGYAW